MCTFEGFPTPKALAWAPPRPRWGSFQGSPCLLAGRRDAPSGALSAGRLRLWSTRTLSTLDPLLSPEFRDFISKGACENNPEKKKRWSYTIEQLGKCNHACIMQMARDRIFRYMHMCTHCSTVSVCTCMVLIAFTELLLVPVHFCIAI